MLEYYIIPSLEQIRLFCNMSRDKLTGHSYLHVMNLKISEPFIATCSRYGPVILSQRWREMRWWIVNEGC